MHESYDNALKFNKLYSVCLNMDNTILDRRNEIIIKWIIKILQR